VIISNLLYLPFIKIINKNGMLIELRPEYNIVETDDGINPKSSEIFQT
jgi:hypothetical protein